MKPLPSLMDPEVQTCPFSAYAQLRKDAPVYHDPVSGMYEVTSYDLVTEILADTERFSNRTDQIGNRNSEAGAKAGRIYREEGYPLVNTPIDSDPPEHRKYRLLVDKAFNLASARAAEPRILAIANGLIDRFASRGRAEFMSEFAIALPVAVITELLGISADKMSEFKRWSDALMGVCEADVPEERLLRQTREVVEMQQYLAGEIAAIRGELAAGKPRPGVMSALVQQEMDGQPLSTGWIVSMTSNLLVGGNETTTSALGSSMLYLSRDPELQNKLRANPADIPAFFEEILRLEAPLQCLWRKTTVDVNMGGITIPKGAIVTIRYGAANRDETRFPNPDEMNLSRSGITQHLTFGRGHHYCIGNILARTELRLGIGLLLKRLRNIRLDGDDAVIRVPQYHAYGPKTLKVTFELA
jgi:cytochrome P450